MCKEIKRNSIQPIENNEGLCYKCLKQVGEENIKTLNIFDRGYGSNYDEEGIKIQLCKDCHKEEYEEWFNEEPTIKETGYTFYKFEDNIRKLVKSFDIRAREIIENQLERYYGSDFDREVSQAWINVELGVGIQNDFVKLGYEFIDTPIDTPSNKQKEVEILTSDIAREISNKNKRIESDDKKFNKLYNKIKAKISKQAHKGKFRVLVSPIILTLTQEKRWLAVIDKLKSEGFVIYEASTTTNNVHMWIRWDVDKFPPIPES